MNTRRDFIKGLLCAPALTCVPVAPVKPVVPPPPEIEMWFFGPADEWAKVKPDFEKAWFKYSNWKMQQTK